MDERDLKAKTVLNYNDVMAIIHKSLANYKKDKRKQKPEHIIISHDAYWTLHHTFSYIHGMMGKDDGKVVIGGIKVISSMDLADDEIFLTYKPK